MAVEVTIPEAGESISEVEVGEWRKAEGDRVEQDEILVDIETDKASMELPAPAAGVLRRILKESGETVGVGDVIAEIDESGGDGEPGGAKAGRRQEKDKTVRRDTAKGERKPIEDDQDKKDERESRDREETDDAKRRGEREKSRTEASDDEEEAVGRKGRETKPGPAKSSADARRVEVAPRVMPAARRALTEHGLSADEVEPSGPGGRVLKEDVMRHVEKRGAPEDGKQAAERAAAAPKKPAPAARTDRAAPAAPADRSEREEIVPMSLLRRRIAQRLVESQQNAALLTTFNECDMSAVMGLRKEHGEAFEKRHGMRLGFMSFFVKTAIEALKRVPQVNAEIRGNDIVFKNYYDIGVAVATDAGLVVPVLRDADRLSFAEIEQTIGDMAARARERKLTIEELQGGTFTISNGGVYGSLMSTPIVNPPQSGILGLHTIQDRPVARDGQVVIRPMMYLALTYDHRLIDGREAVTFLRHIKELIETPARMLMEI